MLTWHPHETLSLTQNPRGASSSILKKGICGKSIPPIISSLDRESSNRRAVTFSLISFVIFYYTVLSLSLALLLRLMRTTRRVLVRV